jgi:hypothetical protein
VLGNVQCESSWASAPPELGEHGPSDIARCSSSRERAAPPSWSDRNRARRAGDPRRRRRRSAARAVTGRRASSTLGDSGATPARSNRDAASPPSRARASVSPSTDPHHRRHPSPPRCPLIDEPARIRNTTLGRSGRNEGPIGADGVATGLRRVGGGWVIAGSLPAGERPGSVRRGARRGPRAPRRRCRRSGGPGRHRRRQPHDHARPPGARGLRRSLDHGSERDQRDRAGVAPDRRVDDLAGHEIFVRRTRGVRACNRTLAPWRRDEGLIARDGCQRIRG